MLYNTFPNINEINTKIIHDMQKEKQKRFIFYVICVIIIMYLFIHFINYN